MASSSIKRSEQFFSLCAGLSVLSWAIIGIATKPWSLVRCCLTILHLIAGLLFLVRRQLVRDASFTAIAACLPACILGGLLFVTAPPARSWPLLPQLLFLLGTVVTASSLLYLGRSFAIFPALRHLVARGPYRLVRHPAYAGELVLALACTVAGATASHFVLLFIAIMAMTVRIEVEERVLAGDVKYGDYQNRVQWRLCPGLW